MPDVDTIQKWLCKWAVAYGYILIIVGYLLYLIVYDIYGKWLLNKKIFIKSITNVAPPEIRYRRGVMSVKGGQITVGFLWTTRTFSMQEVLLIGGYSTDDFSTETWEEFIVLKFKGRKEVVINISSEPEYKEWLQEFEEQLNITIDLEKVHYGTEDDLNIFYKKVKIIQEK